MMSISSNSNNNNYLVLLTNYRQVITVRASTHYSNHLNLKTTYREQSRRLNAVLKLNTN